MATDEPHPKDVPGRTAGLETFGIPGVVYGLLIAIAYGTVAVVTPPLWLIAVLVVYFLALTTAFLLIVAPGPRGDLAAHLRDPRFTQIYEWLMGRIVTAIWRRIRPDAFPPDARARIAPRSDRRIGQTLREAASPALYDMAFRLALFYPFFLPVLIWIATGQPTGFAGAESGAASFPLRPNWWPDRLPVLGAFAIVIAGLMGRNLASASPRDGVRRNADWLFWIAFAGALAVALAGALAVAVALEPALAGRLAIALAAALVVAVALALALAAAVALSGAVAAAVAVAGAGVGAITGVGVGLGAFAGVGALALTLFAIYSMLDDYWGARWAARALLLSFTLCTWLAAALVPWTSVALELRSVFVFLGVLPTLNGLFDFASYAITLTLITWGLGRGASAVFLGLADLAIAGVLFLGLAAAMILTLAGLAQIAGQPLVDLGSLLATLKFDPLDEWWAIFMVFSTLLPTGLHALIALFRLQGLVPLGLRSPVAALVDRAGDGRVKATLAPLAVAAIWTSVVAVLGAIAWGLWSLIPLSLAPIGQWYVDRMIDLAQWSGAI